MSAFGRLVFKTKEMIQGVEAPDVVRNRVSFSLLGSIEGEVSLKGNSFFSLYLSLNYYCRKSNR